MRQICAITEQTLAGNQCELPARYYCLLVLYIVQRPLRMKRAGWFMSWHQERIQEPIPCWCKRGISLCHQISSQAHGYE